MSEPHESSFVGHSSTRSSSDGQLHRSSVAASLDMDMELDDQTELELAPSDAPQLERPSSAPSSNHYLDDTELELAFSGSNGSQAEQIDSAAASDQEVDDENMSDVDVSQVIQDDSSLSRSSSSSEDKNDEPKPKTTLYQRIQAVAAQVRAEEERAAQASQAFGQRVPTPTETSHVSSNVEAQTFFRRGQTADDVTTRDEGIDKVEASAMEVSDEENPTVSKVPTLSQAAERQVLKQLKEAVAGQQTAANYCCGGGDPTSPFIEETGVRTALFGDRTRPAVSPSVVIRWDDPIDENLTRKIQLPLPGKSGSSVIDGFLVACQQSNGLDPTQFSTNFNPNDYGILDAINQILLPDFDHIWSNRKEHYGLVAELVRLNVDVDNYGKPGAKDRTFPKRYPFGSLIVCLPHDHTGGQFQISYKGHNTQLDWGDSGASDIHWVAFHKDCDHEALPVLSGNQLTLNYHLYISEQIGSILRPFPAADPKLSPLYEGVRKIIEQPSFMKEGGILGFHCKHIYGHNDKRANELLPFALKGIDAAIFSVFRALEMKVSVRPMLNEKYIPTYGSPHTYDYGSRASQLADGIYPLKADRNGEVICDRWLAKQSEKSEWVEMEWEKVSWLNDASEPGDDGWELAVMNMKYMAPHDDGDSDEEEEDEEEDEEKLAMRWSHAVILIEIPTMLARATVSHSST